VNIYIDLNLKSLFIA